MKTTGILVIFVIGLLLCGCGEKAVEPTVEAPPSKEGAVQNMEAPLMDQGAATKGRG